MKKFYCCGVDWQHELGEASDLEGKMPLYSTVKQLKEERSCWKECGIVEIHLELGKWVKKQNLFPRTKRAKKQ